MAIKWPSHMLTWCSSDGKTTNLIHYVIVNRRLAGSVQDTKVKRSAIIDVKRKYHYQVVSRGNLKLKFPKGNYLPGSYDVGGLQDENYREIFQELLNTKLESLKFDKVEDSWSYLEKQVVKLLMVS